MDRPLTRRAKPEHLICRSGWALVTTLACAYFAYTAFTDVRTRDYDWYHNWWNVLTWAVWAVFAVGLVSEVRCWRERLLFGVLFVQFLLGCLFSLWSSAGSDLVREARQISLILWCAAALLGILVSLTRQSSDDGS